MSRGTSNWTFKDVETFLKENGFVLHHVRGSHHYFRAIVQGQLRVTQVPYHGSVSIHPKTLSAIIRQSGIPRERWFE